MLPGYSSVDLYRLPYTKDDNPSVIIEPTTDCNLRCPGCYRRSGSQNRQYMTVEEGKRYIDDVLKIRNVSQMLFSGGEPLMYPQLRELVEHARSKGLQVKINTNGVLIDRAKLEELKRWGVEGMQVHLDRHQFRMKSESQVIPKRKKLCRMFREIGGVRLGFTCIVHGNDLSDIRQMADFFMANSDIVSELNFSVYCPMPDWIDVVPRLPFKGLIVNWIKSGYKAAARHVQQAFGFEYGAYLGTKYEPDRPGKLFAMGFYRDGRLVGWARAEHFRQAHEQYHQEHGRYGYGTDMFETVAAAAGLDPKDVHPQYVRVSLPPLLVGEALSICDSCVDALLHNGKLVPMCVLEYVKQGKKVFIEIER